MTASVLVTDARLRGALAVIRSLGSRGIRVTAADADRLSPGSFSRYCSRRVLCPPSRERPDDFVRSVFRELEDTRHDVIIPARPRSLFALARQKRELEKLTCFPFLDYDRLMVFRDKSRAVGVARGCSVRTPETHMAENSEDAVKIAGLLGFPLIVKPCSSSSSEGLTRVDRPEDVRPGWERLAGQYGALILQEYIPWGGMTYDVCVLMNAESEPRAAFVGNRLRTCPPLAGMNAYGQGVDWPELRDTAITLLQSVHWYGPAQVEFRIDPRDGRPVFIEVNPQLWSSMFLAVESGVDFPYLLYRMAVDGDVEPVNVYRTDVKARWFLTEDLLGFALHPRKRSIVRSWLGGFFDRSTKMYLLSHRDPLPALVKFIAMLWYGLREGRFRRALGRHARQRF